MAASTRARSFVAALLAIITTGCNDATSTSSAIAATDDVLLPDVGAGFSLDVAGSGTLDAAAASQATAMDPSEFGNLLGQIHLQHARSRIWTRGADFVSVLVYVAATSGGAAQVVTAQREWAAQGMGVVVTEDPSIAQAFIDATYGPTRARSRNVFCHNEWFTVGRDAFSITRCSATPESFEPVEALATRQYQRARAALGVPAPTP